MKTLQVKIWVLLIVLFSSFAGVVNASIDRSVAVSGSDRLDCLCTVSDGMFEFASEQISYTGSSFDFELPFAGGSGLGYFIGLDNSTSTENMLLPLAQAGPVVVEVQSELNAPKVIAASAGSLGLLVFGLVCYFLFRNSRNIYALLVLALRNGCEFVVLLPGRMVAFAQANGSTRFDGNIIHYTENNTVVPGRFAATTGFAGLLKKLAGSFGVFSGSFYDIRNLKYAAQQNTFYCAVFIALPVFLASVVQRLIWEIFYNIRRRVIRYSAERLGRVRLAAVASGSEILQITKSRPDFYKSFAVSLPALLTGSPLLRGYIVCGEQTDSYLSVYQSRQLPLFNLWSSLFSKKIVRA